ncbi:GSCOCG00013593001-RA-CDS [Cotesia congregata]|nr:GSCOCG00013593001-RA-CDS [Cotesia congregata]
MKCRLNKCKCKRTHYKHNKLCLLKAQSLDGQCMNNDGCLKINYAVCNIATSTCKCGTDYYPHQKQCFVKAKSLGDNCKNNNGCPDLVTMECRLDKCECKRTHYKHNKSCLPKAQSLDGQCMNDDGCRNINYATCNKTNFVCECKTGFYNYKVKCYPLTFRLHGSCQHHEACASVPHSYCLRGTCMCLSGYHESDPGSCVGMVGASCRYSSDCYGSASVCSFGFCKCPYNDGFLSNFQCLLYVRDLSTRCHSDASCRLIPYSTCGPHSCECQSGYKPYYNVCQGPIGARCVSKSNCYVTNSICSEDICRCPEGLTILNNECILGSNLGESCNFSEQCTTRFSYCDGGSCKCRSKYYPINGACVGFNNAICSGDSDCYKGIGTDLNPVRQCLNNECRCLPNYRPESHYCLSLIDYPCDKDDNCYVEGSECRGTCQCPPGHYEKNFRCHLLATSLSDSCIFHEDCQNVIIYTCAYDAGCPNYLLRSQCVDSECTCPDSYSLYVDSRNYCARPAPGPSCQPQRRGSDCPRLFICPNGECVCPTGYWKSKRYCVAHNGYRCLYHMDCGYTNSECGPRKICQCKKDHFLIDKSCYPYARSLGEKCHFPESCATIPNAACINSTCQCHWTHYEVGGSCSKKFSCSTSEQCRHYELINCYNLMASGPGECCYMDDTCQDIKVWSYYHHLQKPVLENSMYYPVKCVENMCRCPFGTIAGYFECFIYRFDQRN